MDEQMKMVIQEIMAAGGLKHPLDRGSADDVAMAAVDRFAARGLIEQDEVEGWYSEVVSYLGRCDEERATSEEPRAGTRCVYGYYRERS